MKNDSTKIYSLEQLSVGDTCIHRLNPVTKLAVTVVYIIFVISFDRYAFGRLIPYILYPAVLMPLSDTPHYMMLKRLLIALPFCLFAGISNVVFDKAVAFSIGEISVSYGVVSLFTILLRTYLCVMGVLILVSVTPITELAKAMRGLRIPNIFVVILEMTYRYIGVLLDEAYSMYIAYKLRSTDAKGIKIRDMGSFVGGLLLRSLDRADRIYNAMKCRGYALHSLQKSAIKFKGQDVIFVVISCCMIVLFRLINVNLLIGGLLER